MKSLRTILFLLACVVLLTGTSLGAMAPGDAAGTLGVQLESIADCQKGSEECELGDLCADAANWIAKTQLALIPAAVLQNDLPAGPLTWGNVTNAVSGQELVTTILTPAQLFELFESVLSHLVIDAEREMLLPEQSQHDGFLQIAGFQLTVDASAPVGARAYRILLSDGTELSQTDEQTLLTVVTTQSVAQGAYGYTLPGEVVMVGKSLPQALSEYLTSHDITEIETNRIRYIGIQDSALVNIIPRWALLGGLAIVMFCCVILRGKEESTKPFRPMQEGETKRKF